MKQSGTTADRVHANSNRNRPENKDNLDSRKNEEQRFKGDDITHNEKDTKEDHLKKKD